MLIAACIIVPQAMVALTSPSVGRMAQSWGRRPLLLLAFAALAVRGLLFATVHDPYLLVGVQVLDGVTAAVVSVMIPLIVGDVAFGSGHFNLAQGVVGNGVEDVVICKLNHIDSHHWLYDITYTRLGDRTSNGITPAVSRQPFQPPLLR